MNQNSQKKKKKSRNKGNVVLPRWVPPTYEANYKIVASRRRFQYAFNPSSGSNVFTFNQAKFGATCVVAATTVLGIFLFEQFKVKKVELYISPPADGSIIDCSVNFSGQAAGAQGDDKTWSAQTFGMTRGAYLCAKPSKMSQSSQWQPCNSNSIVNFMTVSVYSTNAASTTPIACTMDVTIAYKLTNDNRTTNNSLSLTTASVGAMYYLALDNVASGAGASANLWVPDRSLVTTV
jgi:hypothetical protein